MSQPIGVEEFGTLLKAKNRKGFKFWIFKQIFIKFTRNLVKKKDKLDLFLINNESNPVGPHPN